jgi:ABC-type antimicrobial peptide transport system permease subunit
MIRHYLKVAFRNMWKYKSQTFISVAGLAVGFAAFAMATLWLRYETTYDSFHADADRMYCIVAPDNFSPHMVSLRSRHYIGERLKAVFPEIAGTAALLPAGDSDFEYDDRTVKADFLGIDSSFFDMFNVRIIEGSMNFMIHGSDGIAITVDKARQLFGDESPLGKRIRWSNGWSNSEYTVIATVTSLPKRSNYPFDFLYAFEKQETGIGENTLLKLVKDVNIETFKEKLYSYSTVDTFGFTVSKMSLTPLTSVRYTDPNIETDVKYRHIVIFSVAGALLVLCTLFNWLTLFVSRFSIRQRELALRAVFGASNRSLFILLSVEFVVSLIIALLIGVFLIQTVIQPFMKLSGIRLELSAIYLEALAYIAVIVMISLLTFIAVLSVFRRRSLNLGIRRSNRKLFRKTSIVFQLITSIVFAFCTLIILKQMYHLHNTGLGFAVENRGSISIPRQGKSFITALNDKMRQIPEITETVAGEDPFLPVCVSWNATAKDWDGKPENAEPVVIGKVVASARLLSYYEVKLVEGEMLTERDRAGWDVLINESAAKALGWNGNAVGKIFDRGFYKVKGVVKEMYHFSPTVQPRPLFYAPNDEMLAGMLGYNPEILFKYEGSWKTCRNKIEELLRAEYPGGHYELLNTEEEYGKFLKSETVLLNILTLVSLVCLLVCVFGFVSMVSLTCEERRREIAIRKINGATVKDILDIFFKEHLTLLAVGALIAFPAGYLIMKRWLENYVIRTEMSAWIYVAILLALIMAIVLCVGGRVYRTSRENPIEAIK